MNIRDLRNHTNRTDDRKGAEAILSATQAIIYPPLAATLSTATVNLIPFVLSELTVKPLSHNHEQHHLGFLDVVRLHHWLLLH